MYLQLKKKKKKNKQTRCNSIYNNKLYIAYVIKFNE